jgi:hypothetical protein
LPAKTGASEPEARRPVQVLSGVEAGAAEQHRLIGDRLIEGETLGSQSGLEDRPVA